MLQNKKTMPGKVKVKILAGRNLPVMDRSSDTTDAYVEIKLGNITHKTDVFRKSLNPQWNSEWFIFEVDDAELQDEPLQIRLMDYDTYSANDAIGKVYLDLNPLLVTPGLSGRGIARAETCSVPSSGGSVLSGWLPVYDTMHGMRGEVSVIVKVELFSDVNKFRQSSCGVQFFSTPSTPYGFKIQSIQGFVKELVVNDDPEYQWIDKIRTPRASNEARQTLFSQLSGEVRRKIGLKVLELGGNAVVGYQQMFDLEGVTGLVVRGIGTAVTLARCHSDGNSAVTWFKDQHHGNGREHESDRLRLHHSEPVLQLDDYERLATPLPRFYRLQSLPMHEDTKQLPKKLPQLLGSNSSVKLLDSCGVVKVPAKRKLSLSNLFAKSSVKGKITRPQAPTSSNTLLVPGDDETSKGSPKTRIRSRSMICEMSPIQESYGDSVTESQENSPINKILGSTIIQPTDIISLPIELAHNLLDPTERFFSVLEPQKSSSCRFSNAQDETCSSGSEMSLNSLALQAKSKAGQSFEQSLSSLLIDDSEDISSNVVLNATTYPPEMQPIFPYQTRSPRCTAISPVDVIKPLVSTTVTVPAVVHGTTPSRPTPCARRSSESEINTTPKASSLSDSFGSSGGGISSNCRPAAHRQTSVPAASTNTYLNGVDVTRNLDALEYPFLTMKTYPPGFIVHVGGTVSARSVKLLDRINNSEEPETRDNWWTEIRMEVRSHARALGCSVILGYEEHTSISEEVCVLSASGTAAVVKLQHEVDTKDINHGKSNSVNMDDSKVNLPCRVCHIPYSKASIPFPIKLSRCAVCRQGKVPDVLIATIEPPTGMLVSGRGCLIQARLCRPKRAESRGDQQAKEISDGLPFLEYELHRQLINKLRTKGMNAIFHLKVQVSIGERHVVGVATGTALFLSALPTPSLPKPSNPSISSKQTKRGRIHKLLIEAHAASQERYGLNKQLNKVNDVEEPKWTDSDDTDEDANDLDLTTGNKDTCVIEIDDIEDIDVIELLIDPETPEGFDVVTTESVPGLPIDSIRRRLNLQAFNRVWKGKIPTIHSARYLNRCFEMILRSIYFKLRKARPCVITNLEFSVDLPEDDEIQITVLGTAITSFNKTMIEVAPCIGTSLKGVGSTENEMIFHLEDDVQLATSNEQAASRVNQPNRHIPPPSNQGLLKTPGDKAKIFVQKERQPVDIVTLIHLPGSRVERYLGHLNFFFIRESTSIREDGGLSGFMQSFITEVLGIVRAHVSALGGNAMVSYFMTQCVLLHNPHKNQGQCLINVGGDVVQAARCTHEKDV
ncbi:C2 domain-containing protein 5-like isoform X1 [Daphnia carinata]|uniref:C2 domain-containing protein 5-like isoform X1 n=1 Tax=Daphnia carinata TaxID=120202 RepID=UPI00257AA34C|nr:C2 domain-containing protein 5-like isoform X1 [Daphnia carinata]